MTVVAGRGGARMRIGSDRLLLVEGKDEVNLFEALMGHRLGEEQRREIQIIDAGGVDKFPVNLRAIEAAAQARPTLRAIGAVRDADEDAGGAFQSVCQALRNVGYVPPAAHGGFSDAAPAVGVFIVPDGAANGAIETLCRRSQAGDDVSECVEDYIGCLTGRGAMRSRNEDKTFAHAYLAAMDDPVARVGEGAQQCVWDFDSEAFAGLCAFLRTLLAAG